jgi:hypothetical protein
VSVDQRRAKAQPGPGRVPLEYPRTTTANKHTAPAFGAVVGEVGEVGAVVGVVGAVVGVVGAVVGVVGASVAFAGTATTVGRDYPPRVSGPEY